MRPASLRSRVLAMVVATPGMTAAEVAAEVLPVRMAPCPYAGPRSTTAVTRWREERRAAEKAATARVTRVLGKLVEEGLVEHLGAPRLAEWVEPAIRSTATRLIREWPRLLESLDGPASLTPEEADARAVLALLRRRATSRERLNWHVRLVAHLRGEIPPGSVRALLGARPGGQANRAYRRLDEMGVLIAPSQRVPTAAGIALVEREAA